MMRLSTLILFLLGVVVSQVAAIQVFPRSDSLSGVFKRQISKEGCQNTCDTFSNATDPCVTIACICIDTNAIDLNACVNCVVSFNSTSQEIAQANNLIERFDAVCTGISLPPVVLTVTNTAGRNMPSTSTALPHSTSTRSTTTLHAVVTTAAAPPPPSPVPTTTEVVTPHPDPTSTSLSPPSVSTTPIPPGALDANTTPSIDADPVDPTPTPGSSNSGNNLPALSGAVSFGKMYFYQGSAVTFLAIAVLAL